jgi:benzoate-CoA ligase
MNAVEMLLGSGALAQHGARIALICGDERMTYRDLAAQAARASGALAGLGVRPGDRVLLLMRDTPEFAAAWLGIVRLGAVAIALNNKLTEAEYRHILSDSAARLAVIEDVFAAARPDLTAELAREGRLALAGEGTSPAPSWRELQRRAAAAPQFDALPESPAFCLYSSGTTGRPKGVLHAHRSIFHVGHALRRLGMGEGSRIFTTSKFFFAYGLEHGLLGPLAFGATSILCPDWPDAGAVLALVSRHHPDALFSVPTIYRRIIAEPQARLEPLRQVRYFVSAGERLSPQLAQQWKAACGGELLNLYGMSETFCACLLTPPRTSDGNRTGEPLGGLEARLADAHGMEPAAGEPGVLWVRHPAQASGYANLPEETRAHFKEGWFCTRDVFTRDAEGYFVHQGRSDELVKIAGQWVQPGELEEAVAGEATIAEAACVAVPDADGLERLALFVAARGDPAEALRAATAACEQALPRHKRPKWIRAVHELPRTATGKIQRYKLRELLEREQSVRS